MPLSILPTQPRYGRCTPGVWSPHFWQLVSSITPTVPAASAGTPASAAARCRWRAARARSWSHRAVTRNSLEGPHGGARLEGDRLDRLAGQVGQQPPAVGVEVGGRPLLEEAVAVTPEVRREGRPQAGDFLFRHRIPSRITDLSAVREPALYC
jgi:hypothetical protein